MPISIVMPQLGESVSEGVVGRWLKQVGDRVERDEPLVEVITDKVNAEIPAIAAGILRAIIAAEGEAVAVGTEIAVLDEAAPATGAAPAAAPLVRVPPPPATPVAPAGPTTLGAAKAERRRGSPLVRRLARERGIDLAALSGSGLGGRITKRDILALHQADAGTATPPLGGDDEQLRISPVRRLIAEHMVRSTSTIPHATAFVEVDMTGLVRRRADVREAFRGREGFDLTYLPFVVHAAAQALARFPVLNSEWRETAILRRGHVNIGIAVSLEESLVVPVIRDAAGQSVPRLARAIHALSERARTGKLSLEDVREGTFTVNNPGSFGTVLSLPIINEPQAAMLTMDAIVKRPVVIEGDAIAIRSIMFLGLAFDHRVVDGLIAGRFLATAKAHLEQTGPTLDLEPTR